MRFFDAHCHLQDGRLSATLPLVIERALQAGVTKMVCCGSAEGDWNAVEAIQRRYPENVIASYGLHPWYVHEASDCWEEKLLEFCGQTRSPIGECGLDFAIQGVDRTLQESIFRKQVLLAQKLSLPVSIHCRKAWERLATILKETGPLPAAGLIHAYGGSHELVTQFESLGFDISFAGSVTNPNSSRVHKAAETVSDNHLQIETDTPDILPYTIADRTAHPLNEPAYIAAVATSIASIRKTSVENIAAITFDNGMRLFRQ